MNLNYLIEITNPSGHMVKVKIVGEKKTNQKSLRLFLPSWSPGSYLMREYSRNIRSFGVFSEKGERLFSSQVEKGIWEIDWDHKDLKNSCNKFYAEYEIYCHELTVRTSHVTIEHAFLHGPSYLMGVENQKIIEPVIEFKFPPVWAKITTGLKDISKERERFIYQASDYDELLDSPVEIGCHQTDGFRSGDKDHFLAFFGEPLPHDHKVKEDIKTIVDYIAGLMGEMPYDDYTIITHFLPNLYGGLEHLNSTVLQFNSLKFPNRKDYIMWLCLVSHEYFHTWNVKRIRPKELGPFNYTKEAYTKMLWLAEGLTSFVDELFVHRTGLTTIEEYLEQQKENLNRYLTIPGRRYHSLEDSSFNAWIKLYRPDENSINSTISYYLKGGIVFFALNVLLKEKGKSIDDLLKKLWDSYKKNPLVGLEDHQVYQMVEEIAGIEVRDKFENMIVTTEELDIVAYLEKMGIAVEWDEEKKPWMGFNPKYENDRVFVGNVILDGPAYKSGLNAGDEIIAINGQRFLNKNMQESEKIFITNKNYSITISRDGYIHVKDFTPENTPRKIKALKVNDEEIVKKYLC